MKKNIITSIILLSALAAFSQSNNIDVLHYRFNIELSDKNDSLWGIAEIQCIATGTGSQVQFDLAGIKKEKGMIVDHAGVGLRSARSSTYAHANDKVIISRFEPWKKGDTVVFDVIYRGIPDDGLIIARNKYGDKTFFSDNWPDRAHHWIPCVDRPDDKASFEFFVKAPSQYSVISNGVKIKELKTDNDQTITHWKEDIALPTKVMVIGVAKFAVKTYADSPPNIPVSAWVYQQDSLPGFRNYSVAPAILKFMTNYIGPYPYEKLANVQSKTIFGGMENASAIFYEETSAMLFQNIESLFAHEIAHQWFGDMASEKSFPHLWLSEGFATYLTHIYMESKYGTDSLAKEMKKDRDAIMSFVKESNKPVVDSTSPLMDLLDANSYQKGGWVLHMLRRQLGDSIFHSIIRNYYAAYAGKNADTRDFEKICESESGKDLSNFFDQWLYTPGVPKLNVKWSYDAKNKKILLTVKQMQTRPFQMPLELKIELKSKRSMNETLNISKSDEEFSIPVKEKPTQILLDPDTSLLFSSSVQQVK